MIRTLTRRLDELVLVGGARERHLQCNRIHPVDLAFQQRHISEYRKESDLSASMSSLFTNRSNLQTIIKVLMPLQKISDK